MMRADGRLAASGKPPCRRLDLPRHRVRLPCLPFGATLLRCRVGLCRHYAGRGVYAAGIRQYAAADSHASIVHCPDRPRYATGVSKRRWPGAVIAAMAVDARIYRLMASRRQGAEYRDIDSILLMRALSPADYVRRLARSLQDHRRCLMMLRYRSADFSSPYERLVTRRCARPSRFQIVISRRPPVRQRLRGFIA